MMHIHSAYVVVDVYIFGKANMQNQFLKIDMKNDKFKVHT